jgi:type II secretory pathway component GspD/PulD (secretin)
LLDPSGSRLGKSAWGRTIRTETNASATHQTIETRRLPVSPGFPNRISELSGDTATDRQDSAATTEVAGSATARDRDMKKCFEDMGVSFPPGSSITYDATVSELVLKNTHENIETFERLFFALDCVPHQVDIDVSFVAFDLKSIEEVARKSASAAVPGEKIKSLWREGKGRLVGTSRILTRSGVNAQSKGVDEILYPTEFAPPQGTNGVTLTRDPLPGSFETREIGLIANATPTINPDGYTIDLTVVPEFCQLLCQDDVGFETTHLDGKKTSIEFRQPRFHSRNLTVSVVLWDGETLVAGAMPNSGVTEITYVFVTVRLIDPSGRPVNSPDGVKDIPAPTSGAKPAK